LLGEKKKLTRRGPDPSEGPKNILRKVERIRGREGRMGLLLDVQGLPEMCKRGGRSHRGERPKVQKEGLRGRLR